MADEAQPQLRYDFAYTDGSTYARVARLLSRLAEPGLVVDLGCGPGVLSLALEGTGHHYLGIDIDAEAVAAAQERGIDATELDLSDLEAATGSIVTLVAGRRVSAVTMLDVVEHLPDPDRVLGAVARLIDVLAEEGQAPVLAVSIPNVTHADLGAKLITGRWDVTEVGLLDETHVSLFDEDRVNDVMGRAGFIEIGSEDNIHDRTEQEFPLDHPAIGQVTVLSTFLRSLRRCAGRGAETYQFVRCYRRAESAEREELVAAAAPRPSGRPDDPALGFAGPFLSVIMRTQGQRASLVDALTSLAAQTDPDIEVLVMVHHHDVAVAEEISRMVEAFEPGFAARVDVVQVVGGGRSRPLNAALKRVRGRYVALLDDDDVAVANWVEVFRAGAEQAPGTIVRAPCVLQWTEQRSPGPDVVTGFEAPYPLTFDYLDHVRQNRSPPCSYALPVAAIRALGVEFDESLEACEDWKFLMQVARWTGVTDTASVIEGPVMATSVYRRSRDGGGANGVVTDEEWSRYHQQVAISLASEPSLVPAGALLKIRHLYDGIDPAAMAVETMIPAGESGEIERRDEMIAALTNRVEALERSRVWRLTAPVRRLAALRGRLSRR